MDERTLAMWIAFELSGGLDEQEQAKSASPDAMGGWSKNSDSASAPVIEEAASEPEPLLVEVDDQPIDYAKPRVGQWIPFSENASICFTGGDDWQVHNHSDNSLHTTKGGRKAAERLAVQF